MKKEKDQQAFPLSVGNWYSCGMTLRDYFAAKAMQGLVSANQTAGITEAKELGVALAEVSYKISDAMLKEREK